ncbi:MAG: hypothetical protein JOZ69_17910 [Myxococcales bacterium]|nr:hypothetical protein [Myxococcales bacterium]
MLTAHNSNLAAVNERQKINFCNRASAIFPLLLSPRSDLHLLFLNYWRIKNGIQRVQCNIRVFDAARRKALQTTMPVDGTHHDIGMRELVGRDLEGMVEIEFISPENLTFAFPAVTGLYEGAWGYSAVHSAGRVRNAEEPFEEVFSEETNWICKHGNAITPFAHVFNVPRTGAQDSVLLRLYDRSSREIAHKRVDGLTHAAFSSKLLCFDEVFPAADLQTTAFASVTLKSNEVFPRLVVGNYHRSHRFLEATHSFPHLGRSSDYVEFPSNGEYELLAYLALPQPPELELECKMYPTSAPAELLGTVRSTSDPASPLKATARRIEHVTGGPRAKC